MHTDYIGSQNKEQYFPTLTLPTSGGLSVGIVLLRSKATEFFLNTLIKVIGCVILNTVLITRGLPSEGLNNIASELLLIYIPIQRTDSALCIGTFSNCTILIYRDFVSPLL
jgi:hypothetical protein